MSRANIAPGEVKAIAGQIRSDAQRLADIANQLNSRLNQLGSAWQDAGYAKFQSTLQQTIKSIQQLQPAAEQHVAYLNKKAAAAEAYLST